MSKFLKHIKQQKKWYLLGVSIAWIICIWLFPFGFWWEDEIKSYIPVFWIADFKYIGIWVQNSTRLLSVIMVFALFITISFLVIPFTKNKKINLAIYIYNGIFILASIIHFSFYIYSPFWLYFVIIILFYIISIFIYNIEKIINKLSNPKKLVSEEKKLQTQQEQIDELQKQIDELKNNTKDNID